MASRKLSDLAPVFLPRVAEWLVDCEAEGLDVLVYCTLRSHEEQARLYKIGRTVKGADVTASRPMGRIVTKAKPGQSAHNYGLAIDFVPMKAGKAMWSDTKAYDKAIKLAAARDMQSLRPMESPHLQMPDWRKHIL